jgi:DNA-binding winged helix-turn-helix (wHTH) protein
MKDEVRKAVETIRKYLYELKEKNDSKLLQVKKEGYNDYDEAIANILDGAGITPAELTDHMVWSAIKHKTNLLTEHQLALMFDLICNELEGMELEGFEENEYISGMVTSDNVFLHTGEHATFDSFLQTDKINMLDITEKTLEKLEKAGHPEVCRRLKGKISYIALCESIFGSHLLERKPYPVHRIQINIRNIGDHNLTSIINRIREMLRKTIPDPKNKRKLRRNIPVYVMAKLEKDSQQRWKDTWYWICKAKLLEEDDPLLEYTEYTDSIGNTLSSRYNSAAFYFEDN